MTYNQEINYDESVIRKYLPVIFLTIYILSLVLLYKHFNGRINQLKREKENLQTMLSSNRNPALNLNDLYLFNQKTKTLSTKIEGKLYFDYVLTSLNREVWQIDIILVGDKDVVSDAADLQLDYSSNLDIVEINFGKAFPLYPRSINKDNQITITGISTIEKNKIIYASPGNIFATLVVKKKQDNLDPQFIQFNKQGTKIYYASKNITDEEKQFSRIEI